MFSWRAGRTFRRIQSPFLAPVCSRRPRVQKDRQCMFRSTSFHSGIHSDLTCSPQSRTRRQSRNQRAFVTFRINTAICKFCHGQQFITRIKSVPLCVLVSYQDEDLPFCATLVLSTPGENRLDSNVALIAPTFLLSS